MATEAAQVDLGQGRVDARRVGIFVLDLLRYRKGARLANGNALVGRFTLLAVTALLMAMSMLASALWVI